MQMSQAEVTDLLHKLAQEIKDNTEKQLKDFFNELLQLQEKRDKKFDKMLEEFNDSLKETIKKTIEKSIDGKIEETVQIMKDITEGYRILYDRVNNIINNIKDYDSSLHLNVLKPKDNNYIYNELVEKIAETSKENGMFEKENEILKENLKIKLNELVLSPEDLRDFYKLFSSKNEKVPQV